MATLADTFRSPESMVTKVVVAVDLKGSTSMKEQQPQAAWLTTYGWFFDLLGDSVASFDGVLAKYLGDGALAVFPEDNAADGVNWAISVQEAIADAQAKNIIACDCTIGVSYGEVVEFDTPLGAPDYIGTVVDKAFRLSDAANAKAVFVDTDTINAAAMNRVKSRFGLSTAPRRKVEEYLGPVESVKVKGFSSPVSYHELLWAQQRFGIDPPFVTELSEERSTRKRTTDIRAPGSPGGRPEWIKGFVNNVFETHGFITGPDDESFWYSPDYLFRHDAAPARRDDVWFTPAEPFGDSPYRRAENVIPFRARLEGVVQRVLPNGNGFVQCDGEHGRTYQFYVALSSRGEWSGGDPVSFEIGENPQGPSGYEPEEL